MRRSFNTQELRDLDFAGFRVCQFFRAVPREEPKTRHQIHDWPRVLSEHSSPLFRGRLRWEETPKNCYYPTSEECLGLTEEILSRREKVRVLSAAVLLMSGMRIVVVIKTLTFLKDG